MKKKTIIILVVALLIAIISYSFWVNKNKNDTDQKNNTNINNTTTEKFISGTSSCANLLSGAIEPLKDLQTFIDKNYNEVTTTSRSSWDKSKLPKKVLDLEAKKYTCYPMPYGFDTASQPTGMNVQPAVTSVKWDCELEYADYKYVKTSDTAGKQAKEKAGFTCKKESCLSNNTKSDYAWLCYK